MHMFGPSFQKLRPANVLGHALEFQKKPNLRRGFGKISAYMLVLHALRHVCGIGEPPTRTEMCL